MSPKQDEELKENTRMTRKMYEVVVGDEKFGQEGIVTILGKHDRRIGRIEKRFMHWGGVVAGLAVAWGLFQVYLELKK